MNIRGTYSAIASFVGAVAVVGFVVFGNGPHAPYGSVPFTDSPAASYAGTDPSVPSASSVFGNRTDDPGTQIETF